MSKPSRPVWKWAFFSAGGLLFAGAWIFIITLGSGFRTYRVSSGSMANAINTGDVILADLHAYKRTHLQRGDVIVFQHGDYTLIKRLIGLPGDSITMTDGKVTVNGGLLSEPYAKSDPLLDAAPNSIQPLTVAPDELFLLGDERDHSLDSRMQEFGHVHLADVRGKVLLVLTSAATPAPHAIP